MSKHITLNGREFLLRADPPKYGRVMLVARAEDSGDEKRVMAAYVNFIEGMLDPSVKRGDFEAALAEMELDELGAALEEAAGQYAEDPSLPGTSGESSPGLSGGTPTRKVVSLSQGTVREVS